MSKPVDLIIANSIHDALARLVEAQTQLAASIDSPREKRADPAGPDADNAQPL